MPEKAIVKEFEQARDKYKEMLKKLIDMKSPAVMGVKGEGKAEATCGKGSCDIGF